MMRLIVSLTCGALVLFAQVVWGAERLVYSVGYKNSGHGYTVVKTEVFSIDPATREKQIIFSDDMTPITVIQIPFVFHFPVVGGNKLFAHAAERDKSRPFPGNGSLYELSIDGSNRVRRICSVIGAESLGDIFVNSTGTRIGYINRVDRKQYVFIHDVGTGTLLSRIDVANSFLDCYASTIGWLPGSQKLYFSLKTGCDDATSDESYAQVGTYFMDEDGKHVKKLPALKAINGYFPPESTDLIGVLPTDQYVFEVIPYRSNLSRGPAEGHRALLSVSKDYSRVEDVSFRQATTLYNGAKVYYQLSPSGKYLSAAQLPVVFSAISWDIWLKDLENGRERIVVSLPTEKAKGPYLGVVGWIQ